MWYNMDKKGWDIVSEPVATPQNLAKLFYIYAYSRGKFLLSSGRESSYYLNGKQVILSARGLYISARLLLERITARTPEAVGGLSFGAAPLAAAVSAFSCAFDCPVTLSSFIVRKELKQHGTHSRIEGPFYQGMRVAVVDDVLTTGGSVLSAVQAVEEAGGIVEKIYVLADRQEGGKEALQQSGYQLESLITRRDLETLDEQLRQKYPLYFNALELKPLDWGQLAAVCKEISTMGGYPRLAAALEQEVAALEAKLGPLGEVYTELRSFLLRPLKIAEFSPETEQAEEEALKALSIGFDSAGGGGR